MAFARNRRGPNPGASMPPRPPMSSASVGAIRATLESILKQPKGSEHRWPCANGKEALSLRARMNRLRATDRQQNYNTYIQANREAVKLGLAPEHVPAGANQSIFDDLIFRVEGSDVIVQVAGLTASDLMAIVGLPAPEAENLLQAIRETTPTPQAPPKAPVVTVIQPEGEDLRPNGFYDTAPKIDEDPFG